MTNTLNAVLYTGMTNDILERPWQHKAKYYKNSFSHRYNLTKLVYYEEVNTLEEAFYRERQIKNWRREWKINLIKRQNPFWDDLCEEVKKKYLDDAEKDKANYNL
ncbi:GIY-YIG nuclease family protein [Candidatus Peregrinibacteria bacterium]|nr:GIY-YIG nuclease family protein [Candidatus Peregrinibacteria bacterium]